GLCWGSFNACVARTRRSSSKLAKGGSKHVSRYAMKRAELYTLVWQNPTVRLAKRFGISNARLRKLCMDYEIPLPPAGYWTKLAHGKAVERPELPQATPGIFSRINSALRQIGEIPLRLADAQIDEFDLKFSSVDEVGNAGVTSSRLLPKSVQLEDA